MLAAAGLAGAFALAQPLWAAEGPAGPTISKRDAVVQVARCMRKRMGADRMLSYNQAAKTCKQLVLGGSGNSAPLVASQGSASRAK